MNQDVILKRWEAFRVRNNIPDEAFIAEGYWPADELARFVSIEIFFIEEERDGLLKKIEDAVNGITCNCSEGVEFMSKMELARAVLKDLKPLTDVVLKRG